MSNFNQTLETTLKKHLDFIDNEGDLYKAKVIDSAWKVEPKLIELLLENREIKAKFFTEIKGHWVFNVALFVAYIQDKNFLSDSWTNFKNKIGLMDGNKFLNQKNDVALVWPFKDCILEGGQTDEESKRKEIFFNEILAQDEIDVLLDPKVLTNFKRYGDENEKLKVKNEKLDGEEIPLLRGGTAGDGVDSFFTRDQNGTIKDNLIIKGNNLLALHTLKTQFSGKVKLIYIDPPYNTGNDGFRYNDNFNHSTWLTFMKNRLEVARELLRDDGVIFVQCDDNEQAYLKVLMDEIFGRVSYLNNITVKAKSSSGASGGGEDKKLKKNTESLIVFANSSQFIKFNDISIEIELNKYIQDLADDNKNFAYNSILIDQGNKKYINSTVDGSGEEIKIYKHTDHKISTIAKQIKSENLTNEEVINKYYEKIYTLENAQTSIRDRVIKSVGEEDEFYSIEYTPKSGKNKGQLTTVGFMGKTKRLVSFLSNTCVLKKNKPYKVLKIGTLWSDLSWSSIANEGAISFDNGKKPEKLIQRIIEMSTQKGDIVLDYHLGSGTTAAVAHKMGRQYIGIEQMDYIETIAVERLKKVIGKGVKSKDLMEDTVYEDFDTGGISKAVNWQGGGSFVYFELKKLQETFMELIQEARTTEELEKIWEQMKEKSFLDWMIDLRGEVGAMKDWKDLTLEKQKQALCLCLDKNQMYVNYSEIDDTQFECTEEEKRVSGEFYGE